MGSKRIISIFSFVLIFLVLLIFAAVTGFFIYAPGYLESKIIPDLMKKAGISLFSLHVRNVGISGAELSAVRFGDGILPGAEIDSIMIDYSPSGLFHRKIERVVLSGISIPLEYRDKSFSIKGLNFKNAGDGGSAGDLSISSVAIKNSRLLLSWEDKELDFPFDADVMFTGQGLTPDRFLLNLSPRGQVVKIAGIINDDKKTISLSFSSEDFLMDAFSDIINDTTGLKAGGLINFNVSMKASLNPLHVTDLNASLQLNRSNIGYEGVHIAGNYNDGDKESPIVIQLKSGDLHLWKFDISRFLISTPVGPVLTAADGNLNIEEKAISADAVLQTNLSGIKGDNNSNTALNGTGITRAPPLRWKVSAVTQKDGPWQVQAVITGQAAGKTPTCGFTTGDTIISSGTPEVHLNAKAYGKDLSASYRLKLPSIRIDNKTAILTISSVTVSGLYEGPYKEPEKGKASFSLKVSDIGINSGTISANAPTVDSNGSITRDAKGNLSVTGDMSFSGAGISVQDQGITIGSISGDLPFQWPFKVDGRSGNINVGSIRLKDLELGQIEAAIQQNKNDFTFNGKYTSRLLPDLVMELSGIAGFTDEAKEAAINISLPDYKVPPNTDLKIIAPGLKNILFEGSVTLSAGISFSEAGPRGKMSLGIKEAQIKAAGNELVLDGISGELNFSDIFSLKSAPKQSLKISKITFRDLKADNLMADFQIESKESIFIEQCRFNWCQGHVNIQSFRFFPGINDYSATFNCDRLNLADILEQFGVAKATGNGAVNGTIPITLSNGQFTFGEGFLYSTPGDGGNIHVTGTEALTAGMPPDSDQYMQMEIAREALKDFKYEWAKMTLSTEDTNMVMKLQFDGKPANALPFVYKKDIGKFIKLEANAQGSIFQGISLDINFRVPLNEILKYNNVLF
jgi:hypothetical protein